VPPAPYLEDYLRTAEIMTAAGFPWSGAHPNKQLIVLDGGIGLVAKPADPANVEAPLMSRCEAAAWLLALELGWSDLVSATVLRDVSLPGVGDLEASLQVLWPAFETATEVGATTTTCSDRDVWRVALFDAIARNTDRNDSNWGFIKGVPDVKLVDHGFACALWPNRGPTSQFVEDKRGHPVPPEQLVNVQDFWDSRNGSRLGEVLDPGAVGAIFDRARLIIQSGALQAP
jgi:hypothetical protein